MAFEIFRLVGSVFVDTDAADKSLQKTDKSAADLGQSLSNGIQAVGRFAAGVAKTAAAAGGAIIAVAEKTREYRTEQGKLSAAFETSGFSAEAARTTYESLNGVLGDSGQAVEAANHLAKLTDNEEQLATWTDICTGIFATFGDSLPIEGLTEAANETAKTGALTGGLADALNWAGVNEDKFQESLDKCNNEQERQALITETLSGLYSEAADTYRETNAEVIAANEAQDKLTQTMAGIGETIEPILSKGKELLADVLQEATPVITDIAQVAIPLLAGAMETLVGWVDTAIQFGKDAYTWMTENETAVTLIAIAVGTFTAALIAYNIAQNASTIATTLATAATTAFGAVMAFVTSPVTLVVVAIGALIAIIYLLIKNWDDVKAAALACWEWIKNAWAVAAEWFNTKVIQPVVKFFKELDASVRKAFSDAWTGVKNAWAGAKNFFSDIWTSIKNTFSKVTDWFRDTFSKAWQAVKNVFSTGGKIFDGIKQGIANVFTSTVNAIIRGINRVIAVPFNTLNGILDRIRGISIMKISPFTWVGSLSVPSIPEMEQGGVLERGQVGLLEGNGAEAVVPLDKNRAWTRAVAEEMDTALGGSSGEQVTALLLDILTVLADIADMDIVLDGDAIVGRLARKIDRALGQIHAQKARA